MKEIKDMDLIELAAFICSYLKDYDIECVLTGGACVSVYTDNKYQSLDLDFIEIGYVPKRKLEEILSKIGFYKERRYFTCQDSKYFIEFPSGPLSIGSEPVKDVNEILFETGTLRLLSPTDSVKDRLAAYFYWDDKQSLEQAIMIADENKIDIKEIERWSRTEGLSEEFEKIRNHLIDYST